MAATKPLELYHFPNSQPSRAVLLFMKVINAPHKIHFVDMSKGEHKEPKFLAINPFHKTPYLVHGDFALTERPAIARYIFNTFKPDDHWYPADVKKRAKVDEYLSYQHTTIRKAGLNVMFAYILQANMSKTDYLASRPKVKEWAERVKADTKPHFDEVFEPFEDFVKRI